MKNSNLLFFYIFAAIFIGVVVFLIIHAIKRREEVFEGQVIDKDVVEQQHMNDYNNGMNRSGINIGGGGLNFGGGGVNGGVTHSYFIKVQTDAGKVIKFQISEGKYEIIKIGDRVSKPKGTTEVNIINSTQVSPIQTQNPLAQPANTQLPIEQTNPSNPIQPMMPVAGIPLQQQPQQPIAPTPVQETNPPENPQAPIQ